MDKTMVIGVSQSPARYANLAVSSLLEHGYQVVALGRQAFVFKGVEVMSGMPAITGIHTVTLYINPFLQQAYYQYILNLKPKRIIFNPGTENPEFQKIAESAGILVQEDCTLVLLSTAQY
jgi:predicted CoA-binding protein